MRIKTKGWVPYLNLVFNVFLLDSFSYLGTFAKSLSLSVVSHWIVQQAGVRFGILDLGITVEKNSRDSLTLLNRF